MTNDWRPSWIMSWIYMVKCCDLLMLDLNYDDELVQTSPLFYYPSRRSCLSVCPFNSQTNTAIVVMPIHLQRGNLMNCCPGVAWWNYVVSDCFLCWLLASCWLRVSAGSVVGSLSRVLPSPVLAWTLSMNVVLSRAGCWFLVCAVV